MKKSNYMTRAMRARDPRFASVLAKLGYEHADMRASADQIAAATLLLQAEAAAAVVGAGRPRWLVEIETGAALPVAEVGDVADAFRGAAGSARCLRLPVLAARLGVPAHATGLQLARAAAA